MKLLTYTRYIRKKIKFYDRLAKKNDFCVYNPFNFGKESTTVLWVEDRNDGSKE